MIVNLVLNCPISRLNIYVADKNLFVIEATDCQNCRRGLEESIGSQFNHSVTDTRLRSTDEYWGDRRLGHGLLVLLFLVLFRSRLGFRLLLLFFFLLALTLGWLDRRNLLFFWLRLQVGQLLSVSVKIEQLRDSVRLAQRRVDVDVAVTAPRREVLSLQFAERNNLNDRLSVGPRLDRQLIASRFTEDYDMTLALTTDQELFFLTRDLH